jgi:hypothetical protein
MTYIAIALAVIIVAALLWIIIKIAFAVTILRKLKFRATWKDCWKVVVDYVDKRRERSLFAKFMLVEAGLVGGPQYLKVYVAAHIDNVNANFFVVLGNNADWVSVVIAICIAMCYYWYLRTKGLRHPEKWKEIIDAAHFINTEFRFSPNIQWFVTQNKDAITSLGHRYSAELNFPYGERDWMLATLRNDGSVKELLRDSFFCVHRKVGKIEIFL